MECANETFPVLSARRAMIVDLALSVTGSQLIASVLPTVRFNCTVLSPHLTLDQADKDQRALLYECIRGHIVTLRGCKTGSKVIWLLYVHSFVTYSRFLILCYLLYHSDRMVSLKKISYVYHLANNPVM